LYPSIQITNAVGNPPGTGLWIGWRSTEGLVIPGGTQYGIDKTSSNPYIAGESEIETDLIPIGTYQKPRDLERVEFKLNKPLISGEYVSVYYRLDFSQGYTPMFIDDTVGDISNSSPVNFKNAQWVQFKIVTASTLTDPSYVRLKEIRILGLKE